MFIENPVVIYNSYLKDIEEVLTINVIYKQVKNVVSSSDDWNI